MEGREGGAQGRGGGYTWEGERERDRRKKKGTAAKHFEYFIQAVLIINKFLGNHFVTQYNIFSLINKWV